mmetsp:Transcript_29738/g.45329  ORF Transcript_29738/g.45329 Transcript_29738/m.45329 type:complete len:147 (-) Transcript_29738:1796-2236(-)
MMSFTDQAHKPPKSDLYLTSATRSGLMDNAPLAQRLMKLPGDKPVTVANQINMQQPQTISGISELNGSVPPRPQTNQLGGGTTTHQKQQSSLHQPNIQPRVQSMTSHASRPNKDKKNHRQVYMMADSKLKSLPSSKPKANSSLMWL